MLDGKHADPVRGSAGGAKPTTARGSPDPGERDDAFGLASHPRAKRN